MTLTPPPCAALWPRLLSGWTSRARWSALLFVFGFVGTPAIRADNAAAPAASPTPDEALWALVTAKNDDGAAAKEALAHGADPNRLVDKVPVLSAAARRGEVQILQALLDAGADVHAHDLLIPALSYATATGTPATMQALLDAGADPAAGGEGVTPLHWAAERAQPEAVRLLLDAGADPAAKNAKGQTPADIARAGNHPELADLIESYQPGTRPAPTGNPLPASTDLQQAVTAAADGATLVLGPGTYAGSFQLQNKSLTLVGAAGGGTILSGGAEPAAAVVLDGGHLTLRNVTLAPAGKSTVGIFVRGGSVFAADCQFETASDFAVYAENGTATLIGCEFKPAGKAAVAALSGAHAVVRSCAFAGGAAGVVAQEAAELGVFSCRFTGVRVAIQSRGGGVRVAVRRNRIINPKGFEPQSLGVAVDGAQVAVLDNNEVVNTGQGLTLSGGLLAPAVLRANTVIDARLGCYISATCDSPRPAVTLASNRIFATDECGVLVDGTAHTAWQNNNVVARKASGVIFQNNAGGALAGDFISGPEESIGLRDAPATGVVVHDVLLAGPAKPGPTRLALDESSARFVAAVSAPETGAALRDAADHFTADLADVAESNKSATDAFAALKKALADARQAAGTIARVALTVTDDAGIAGRPDFDVFYGGGSAPGRPTITQADLTNPDALLERLGTGTDPLATALRQKLFPGGYKAPANDDERDERIATVLEGLNAILRDAAAFQDSVVNHMTLPGEFTGPINALQKAGAKAPPDQVQTLDRAVLEAALPGLIARSGRVGGGDAASPWLYVPAGTYWIAAKGYSQLVCKVSPTAGQSLEVELAAANSLWLSVAQGDQPPVRLLVLLKPPAQRRAALAKMEDGWNPRGAQGLLRPGLTAAQRADALAVARREFPKLANAPEIPDGADPAAAGRQRQQRQMALNEAVNILAVAGDRSDAELLASVPAADFDARRVRAQAIAYLESRLGTLEHGQLVRLAKGGDPQWAAAAAILLHDYGVPTADATLRKAAANVAEWQVAQNASRCLMDDASSETLAAMRAHLARTFAASENPSTNVEFDDAAVDYLIAYGDKSDWARIERLAFHAEDVAPVFLLASDPLPLALAIAEPNTYTELPYGEAYLRDLPPAQATALGVAFQNAVYTAGARGATASADLEPAYTALNTYCVMVSSIRPNARAAKLYFDPGVSLTSCPWMPCPWRYGEILDSLVKGTLGWGWKEFLDYLPHDTLLKELADRQADTALPYRDLFVANHLVSTKAFVAVGGGTRDGVERRPFAVRDLDKQGSIDGLLEARPKLEGRKLTVELRFTLVAHYNVGSFIDFNEGDVTKWEHHKYVVDGGKLLLGGVALRHEDEAVPLVERGPSPAGGYLYEADLNQDDLSGLLLDVTLQFFDQRYPVVFDLFASDCARDFRRGHASSP